MSEENYRPDTIELISLVDPTTIYSIEWDKCNVHARNVQFNKWYLFNGVNILCLKSMYLQCDVVHKMHFRINRSQCQKIGKSLKKQQLRGQNNIVKTDYPGVMNLSFCKLQDIYLRNHIGAIILTTGLMILSSS
jgi:hypothetical protein